MNEGKGDDFVRGYRELALRVRQDTGAITYLQHRAMKDRCEFFFHERYESDEALKYQSSAPHAKEFFQTIGPIMRGRPEITRYTEVE